MICRRWLLSILPFSFCISNLHSIEIDNNVIGDPIVECAVDFLSVFFETRRPFSGKIYVKGHSTVENCFHDNSIIFPLYQHNRNGSLRVHYGTCNVQRDRSINPRGVFLRTSVIIQFHSVFTTKVDKAYRVSCFYQESIRTVSANIDVSVLTTSVLRDGFSMPECTYSVRKETFDGPFISFAKVGDTVVHRWECKAPPNQNQQNNYPYGMLVHSCYVTDGHNNSELVVDDKGCSLDPYILDHLVYTDSLLVAYKESQVFKFADENLIYFSCQIRMCLKTMDSCRGTTPPNCLPLKNKRHLNDDGLISEEESFKKRNLLTNINSTEDYNVIDVHSEKLFIFDSTSESESFFLDKIDSTPQTGLCLNLRIVTTISTVVSLVCCWLALRLFITVRRKYGQQLSTKTNNI